MTAPLAGKAALVTGAARNIGRAIALDLARHGAHIAVHANTSADAAQDTIRQIQSEGGQATLVQGNLTDPAEVHRILSETTAALGRLDILVNNAALRRETKFENITYAEWREVTATILDAAFLTAQAALPALKAAGSGAIINLGGMSAHTGTTDRAHVVAAKTALIGLTRALAFDLAPFAITANIVVPGHIDTQRGPSGQGSNSLLHQRQTLAGRKGTPEEIAATVTHLAQARYITGQTVHINGGAYLP